MSASQAESREFESRLPLQIKIRVWQETITVRHPLLADSFIHALEAENLAPKTIQTYGEKKTSNKK
jgi:hypothetical protein